MSIRFTEGESSALLKQFFCNIRSTCSQLLLRLFKCKVKIEVRTGRNSMHSRKQSLQHMSEVYKSSTASKYFGTRSVSIRSEAVLVLYLICYYFSDHPPRWGMHPGKKKYVPIFQQGQRLELKSNPRWSKTDCRAVSLLEWTCLEKRVCPCNVPYHSVALCIPPLVTAPTCQDDTPTTLSRVFFFLLLV